MAGIGGISRQGGACFTQKKNRISKQFVFKKDTEASFKTKITNHGKKKNDKDEIGDILLKHAFTSL